MAFWGGLQANGKGVSTECAQADRSPEYRLCGRKLGVRFELSNTHGETTLWSAFRGTSAFEVTMVVRPFLTRLPTAVPACLPACAYGLNAAIPNMTPGIPTVKQCCSCLPLPLFSFSCSLALLLSLSLSLCSSAFPTSSIDRSSLAVTHTCVVHELRWRICPQTGSALATIALVII